MKKLSSSINLVKRVLLSVCLTAVLLGAASAGAAEAAAVPSGVTSPGFGLQATDIQQQNSYYVSPQGNDSAAGTRESPWRTLSAAIRRLNPGDTLFVRAGIYQGSVEISVSGRIDAPINITAYPGETPVIDGNRYFYPQAYWGALLKVSGEFVNVSGFEVQYSNYMGVLVTGRFSTVSKLNVHHNMENGIFLLGDNSVADGNTVWMNCLSNENGSFTRTSWASGLSAGRHPNFAIIRNNKVYNNFGEGLSTYEANGPLIEGNEVFDNWATNIYISDATNVILINNYIYNTDATLGQNGNYVGIMLGDEQYDPPSANITIIDNIVYNTNINLYWWQGVRGGGMKDVTIRNNTFINSREKTNIQISRGPH
ncbi:MAG: right-handed parallel beta-helix repeat-containing protein, partial [Anaerolineaceae bacterium]